MTAQEAGRAQPERTVLRLSGGLLVRRVPGVRQGLFMYYSYSSLVTFSSLHVTPAI